MYFFLFMVFGQFAINSRVPAHSRKGSGRSRCAASSLGVAAGVVELVSGKSLVALEAHLRLQEVRKREFACIVTGMHLRFVGSSPLSFVLLWQGVG